jgi:hypothetical protein
MRDPITESDKEGMKSLAPRIDSLEGKRIGFHVNTKEASKPVAKTVEEKLIAKYPGIETSFCTIPARDTEALAEIETWANNQTDACIATIGDCGGCTRAVVRAANAIEESETPAVGIVANEFELSWETNAKDQQRYLRKQSVPIKPETTDRSILDEAIDDTILQGIEDALTVPLTDEEKGLEERDLLS